MFNCKRCRYYTKYKSNLKNHLSRKNPCKAIFSNSSRKTLKLEINRKLIKPVNNQKLINKMNPNESKMNPNESKMNPNESKMNPSESKMNPNESKMNPNESKMNPSESKMNLSESKVNLSESKVNLSESKVNLSESKINPSDFKMNLSKNKKKYQCKFCKKIYSTNSNLHKHKKKCKNVKVENYVKVANHVKVANDVNLIKHMHNQIEELKQEKAEMKKSIEVLLEKVGNVTNNINTQQNVFINTHGQENLDYITSKYLNNLLRIPYGAVSKLLKDIHFHPEHPENCNIKITNKKLRYATVWEGDKWKIKNKREIIESMVDKGFNIIDGQYNKNKDNLENLKKKKYLEFQDKFENKDKKLHKELLKDMEVLVINNS